MSELFSSPLLNNSFENIHTNRYGGKRATKSRKDEKDRFLLQHQYASATMVTFFLPEMVFRKFHENLSPDRMVRNVFTGQQREKRENASSYILCQKYLQVPSSYVTSTLPIIAE